MPVLNIRQHPKAIPSPPSRQHPKAKEVESPICVYIITQAILQFWLVLAYDLLEDRRTIDVIIAKVIYPLCFKMAESLENFDNILRDWAKDKVQKSLAEA